jgi:hypothetical protein
MKPIDITGKTFGRLTAISRSERQGRGRYWNCTCVCGGSAEALAGSLTSGNTKSCGCISRELVIKRNLKHGKSGTSEHEIWRSMLARCSNPNATGWDRYGGRGIKVCDRWNDFSNFFADMGEKPIGMSIDRVDNDGDYCPENCRWATRLEQNNNARSNTHLTAFGETMTVTQWSRDPRCAIANSKALRKRIVRGWDHELAITTPSSKNSRPAKAAYDAITALLTGKDAA